MQPCRRIGRAVWRSVAPVNGGWLNRDVQPGLHNPACKKEKNRQAPWRVPVCWCCRNGLLDLLNAGQYPATAAVARLGHVPDLGEGLGGGAVFLADQAVEMDADDVAAGFFRHVEHLGVELGDIGRLLGALALVDAHLDLGEHFRRGEFADVVQIAGVVGGLKANEVHLGIAHEAVDIEVGSPVLKAGVDKPTGGKDFDIAPAREVIPLSGGDIRGSYVKLTFEGKAILWGYAAFAWADAENGEYTVVHDTLLLDEEIDTEASAKKKEEAADVTTALTPVFRDGRNELLYQIGGLVHRLANGNRSVPVTIKYRNVADLSCFTIAATYADQETNGEVPVEISVDATDYKIVGIISIVSTQNGVSVSNVTPKPNGVVRPTLLKFGPDGKIVTVPGDAIEWGDGLDVILDLIPAGKILRVLGKAESIGGRGATLVGGPLVVAENPLLICCDPSESTQSASVSGKRSISAFPSSIGIQKSPVVSASARAESPETTVTES